jgi:hypothetical protein
MVPSGKVTVTSALGKAVPLTLVSPAVTGLIVGASGTVGVVAGTVALADGLICPLTVWVAETVSSGCKAAMGP